MKKSDLENYMIVETREGNKYMVLENRACRLKGYIDLEKYNEDLTEESTSELDIVKVYKLDTLYNLPTALENCFDYKYLTLIWEEKPKIKLTEDEKVILRNIDNSYKYIVRDDNGALFIYENKPIKDRFMWNTEEFGYSSFTEFNHLFKMVKWEDEEPTLIADLLKGGE